MEDNAPTTPKLDIPKIRSLIAMGLHSLKPSKNPNAVIVVGDTGVGKSTIISILANKKLTVKSNGLNTVITSTQPNQVKIGHNRYSQTTSPIKIVIQDTDFYDCSGFKDNRGDEYEISNSFFLQRLFTLYKQIKLLLIIDQHHISEARIDRLPHLIRSLAYSYGSLDELKHGVTLLINRTKPTKQLKDYTTQLINMTQLKDKHNYYFNPQQRSFLQHITHHTLIIPQTQEKHINLPYNTQPIKDNILNTIQHTQFLKSKHIKNVLSQDTKLTIRAYIDDLTQQGQTKFPKLAKNILLEMRNNHPCNVQTCNSLLNAIKKSEGNNILQTLNDHLPSLPLYDLENDFASIMFFKDIYDQSTIYFNILRNIILAQLNNFSNILEKEEEIVKKKQEEIKKIRQENEMLRGKKQTLEKELYSEKQMKNMVLKSSEEIEKQYRKKLSSLEIEDNQRKKQNQKKYEIYKKKQQQVIREIQQKNKDIQELVKMVQELKISNQSKEQEIQLLSMENQSLKSEIENHETKSIASIDSKSSKYPYVECPHFRNGGKCKHCIKKWKDSLKN